MALNGRDLEHKECFVLSGSQIQNGSTKDDDVNTEVARIDTDDSNTREARLKFWTILDRRSYYGSLIFTLGTFLLPALYSALSKLCVANIYSSHVVTTDVYTYIGVVANVLNDGLPRTAWVIIGDTTTREINSRISLTYTLITVQIVLGAILTVGFVASADRLAAAFVPESVRKTSLTYVRISSIEALSSGTPIKAHATCRATRDTPLSLQNPLL